MTDPLQTTSDIAKATSEVAKTAGQVVDATKQLGGFVAKYIGGPLAQASGIVEDKLKYMRWENQVDLMLRAEAKLTSVGLTSPNRAIPMKLVARQGNETAELFIIVSPGDVDPDADAVASTAKSDYLAKLTTTAREWAPKLAGRVSVVNIKRGNGSEQAFHDRYICVIDQKGIPQAYLLSNSLSKAAGDWPFTICQLNQVISWRIYAYILEMVEGKTPGLQPEVIWTSTEAPSTSAPGAVTASSPSKNEAAWVATANALLVDIWNVIIRNSDFKPQVGARIDAFSCAWRDDIDIMKFADALFKVVKHRDAIRPIWRAPR
ncbi:VPA1262 family N-terminal domain-containing protein [Cupriavidus basilensis]|uniref:VPA1262 family N-terminal domain-containing protein n=1 Tax=Cupriavidus basilensis TaxID=68895 RepID=UPI0028440A22|nr:VPA1262 family N-terminal domain-containing protein [Cupriavidus basilensis]MDR3383751.1 VPA1262 family N-terminal domain-containing protein [Cupriavidus basilensis]